MADLRLILTLGVSMVLMAGGAVVMYPFFGWVGVALFIVFIIGILAVMQYFAAGGGGGGGGGQVSRRRESKGASTRDR